MPEIIYLDDSDDDEIPAASGLTSSMGDPARINDGAERINDTSNLTSSIHSSTGNSATIRNHASISRGTNDTGAGAGAGVGVSQPRPRPKKKTKPTKAYCLVWVTPHGISPRRYWTKMQLKIVGVYSSKADAEQEKKNLMNRYENGGHGDIDLDGSYEGEISLVVREAPMNF